MITPFDQAVNELPVPVPPAVTRTLSLIYHMMEGDSESWQGACHTLTAIAYVLLAEQGIEATPCWGDVVRREGPFAHSWLEVSGEVNDLAIAHPNQPHLRLPPVIAGRSLFDGKPPALVYGASPASYGGNIALGDPEEDRIKRLSLSEFFDGAEAQGLDLWFFVIELGRRLGLSLDRKSLRERYTRTYWTIRDQAPVPRGLLSGWQILH